MMRSKATLQECYPANNHQNIEFDSGQVVVETDVTAIREFVATTYKHMLVDHATSPVGRIAVTQTRDGFLLAGADDLQTTGESPHALLPLLKEEIIVQFMRARPDLLWLHAAAVERDDKAVLIAGNSGQGKSTFATILCDSGWRLMSDDVAPMRMGPGHVIPFCQSPTRRVNPGRLLTSDEVSSLEREAVAVPLESLRTEPAVVRAVVFPKFKHGAPAKLSAMELGNGAFEFLKHSRNLVDRRESAVDDAARFSRTVPMFQLCYGDPNHAVALISRLLE